MRITPRRHRRTSSLKQFKHQVFHPDQGQRIGNLRILQRYSLSKKWAIKELISKWSEYLSHENPPIPSHLSALKILMNKILHGKDNGRGKDKNVLDSLIKEELELLYKELNDIEKIVLESGIVGDNEVFTIKSTGKNIAIAEAIKKELEDKHSLHTLLNKLNLVIIGNQPREIFKNNKRLGSLPNFKKNPELWKGAYLRVLLCIYILENKINIQNTPPDPVNKVINISKKELENLHSYPSKIIGLHRLNTALGKSEIIKGIKKGSRILLVTDNHTLWSSEFYQPTPDDWDTLLVYTPSDSSSKYFEVNKAITASPLFKVKNSFFTSSVLILDSIVPWMKQSIDNNGWKSISKPFEDEIKDYITKSTNNFSESIFHSNKKCKGLGKIHFKEEQKSHEKLYNDIQQHLMKDPNDFPGEIDCFAPIRPCEEFNEVRNQSFILIECKSISEDPGKNFIQNISPDVGWVRKIVKKKKWLHSRGFHDILCVIIIEGVEFTPTGSIPEKLLIIDSIRFKSTFKDYIENFKK